MIRADAAVDPAGLRVTRDADLTRQNTLRLVARTDLLVEVLDHSALESAIRSFGPPRAVIGGGSNIVPGAYVEGPVFRMLGEGFEVLATGGEEVTVRVEAGVEWDACVDRCIEAGAHGIENLALIPGLAGAAPIQNIGAYGVEIAEYIEAVETCELATLKTLVMTAADCAFGYRDSIFKREPGKYLVTALRLRFARAFVPRLGYAGLSDALLAQGHPNPSAMQVAAAVRNIRRGKLPDPAVMPNAGSFFKNPLTSMLHATSLRERWPRLPVFPQDDGRAKLSAAWLIEACGLKGASHGDAAISTQHALVMTNRGHASCVDVLALADRVVSEIDRTFGVKLEREPVVI